MATGALESSYKKRSIPPATRRAVARRAAGGMEPERGIVECAYCGEPGRFWWPRRRDGKPGCWVHFTLELDHVIPERHGGPATADNIVTACRSCNRRKGSRRVA